MTPLLDSLAKQRFFFAIGKCYVIKDLIKLGPPTARTLKSRNFKRHRRYTRAIDVMMSKLYKRFKEI